MKIKQKNFIFGFFFFFWTVWTASAFSLWHWEISVEEVQASDYYSSLHLPAGGFLGTSNREDILGQTQNTAVRLCIPACTRNVSRCCRRGWRMLLRRLSKNKEDILGKTNTWISLLLLVLINVHRIVSIETSASVLLQLRVGVMRGFNGRLTEKSEILHTAILKTNKKTLQRRLVRNMLRPPFSNQLLLTGTQLILPINSTCYIKRKSYIYMYNSLFWLDL